MLCLFDAHSAFHTFVMSIAKAMQSIETTCSPARFFVHVRAGELLRSLTTQIGMLINLHGKMKTKLARSHTIPCFTIQTKHLSHIGGNYATAT